MSGIIPANVMAILVSSVCLSSIALAAPLPAIQDERVAPQRDAFVLVADMESLLSSQMDAKITHMPVKEGMAFTAGQTLVEFDCALLKTDLARAEAGQKAAQATFDSRKKLQQLKSVSALDVLLADADLSKARADTERGRTLLKYCTITAPYDGAVVEWSVHPFETVKAGQPLLKIVSNERLKFEMLVRASAISDYRVGTPLILHMDDSEKDYSATLTQVVPHIDPVSQTVKVVGELSGDISDLIPGMTGNARLDTPDNKINAVVP
ncbi:MAG: efflux RND transporter periplasmic adaptor subunit [Rickettsiales bacterium]|nr:efflux RND transporter periplasmic adaptor subunit [Rickettsiales bacterium]